MRKLKIGQTVHFDHIASPEYDDKDNRTIKAQRIKPMIGKIVGIAVKREGRFYKANGSSNWSGYEDYTQAYLSVSKDVQLWEVKTGYRNKVLHVFDEHIKPVVMDDVILMNEIKNWDIPYTAPKPTTIINEVSIKENCGTVS